MDCFELTVQFENSPTEREAVARPEVEDLRMALEETLDATLRTFHDQSSARGVLRNYPDYFQSDVLFSGNDCILMFQLKDAEPLSCRLFEQFATHVIQCVASTYLFTGTGVTLDSLLPDLYEDRVLLFWGSFTKHAPLSPITTRLALRSPTCRFEKTLDRTEYREWVTNFDRLTGNAGAKRQHSTESNSERRAKKSAVFGAARTSERRTGPFADLAGAADAQDEDAFVRALAQIHRDDLAAEDYIEITRLALAAGAYISARELAAAAHELFPRDRLLRQFASMLSPPELRSREQFAATPEGEQVWLRNNASRYSGQWVALRGGDLLAAGSTLSEVRKSVGSLTGVFVTRLG